MKKILEFLSENFQFLEVKFSMYLNRRVFVMYVYEMKVIETCFVDFLWRLIRVYTVCYSSSILFNTQNVSEMEFFSLILGQLRYAVYVSEY